MKHTDEETLAMMALGEETDPWTSLHLHECEPCRKEYDNLRRIVTTMKTPAPAEHDLLAPPDDLWQAIAAELQVSDGQVPSRNPLPAPDSGAASSAGRPRLNVGRRMGRNTLVLAACAALLGAASGSALTWWLTRPPTPAVQAVADGKPLDSLRPSSVGYASLKDTTQRRSLEITVKGLPKTTGYFEVWLMDRTHTKLVSMGVLGPDGHATLPVPATIDLNEYPVVDVSVQAYNGKPDHSGDSIVRGTYTS
ncbi:anti-sigma factor domain-containing protein [Streptomyces sp. NPDC048018]|uniref:anti-sigma factor n=1 Tax=Streptomyces sp. NPDC048018 TaxID=3365499 RepID=UPI00371775DA